MEGKLTIAFDMQVFGLTDGIFSHEVVAQVYQPGQRGTVSWQYVPYTRNTPLKDLDIHQNLAERAMKYIKALRQKQEGIRTLCYP